MVEIKISSMGLSNHFSYVPVWKKLKICWIKLFPSSFYLFRVLPIYSEFYLSIYRTCLEETEDLFDKVLSELTESLRILESGLKNKWIYYY